MYTIWVCVGVHMWVSNSVGALYFVDDFGNSMDLRNPETVKLKILGTI